MLARSTIRAIPNAPSEAMGASPDRDFGPALCTNAAPAENAAHSMIEAGTGTYIASPR